MEWGELTSKHHGLKVSVSAKSTTRRPEKGEGPFVGYVVLKNPDELALLLVGKELHHFSDWWEVEILDS